MWSRPDILGLFSINVVSFSRNVVLSALSFSANVVRDGRCFRARAFMFSGRYSYKGNEYSEPIWQLEINAEHDHRKRPKHGEVPLSEIDHVCGPVNEYESKRDQGINTADAEAGEEKLESYAHRHCACSGSGHAAPPRRFSIRESRYA